MSRFISIKAMADAVNRADGTVVLDVRPMAAFNGWVLKGETRGGHIPGAVPFPISWLRDLEDDAVSGALRERDVTPTKDVIVYGYRLEDAEHAAARLESLGYGPPRVLSDGQPAWAEDPEKPMDRLPRYRQLVHARWISQLLKGENPPQFGGGRYVLAHTSFDNREDYDEGHIPGAVSLDTLFLEEPEHWNRRNPEELEQALLAQGITQDTTVVLYGRCGSPTMRMESPGRYAGQIAAMRAALLLLYAGVDDVRVLDGGLAAWLAEGNPISTEETPPQSVENFGKPIPACPGYVVDMDVAKELIADPKGELVSMRSWEEYIGETSGYHYIGPKGRIPGAVFGNCGSDAYHMENYRNHDNTMRCYHDIAARWREMGITPDKRIAFYCGTGWRASESFFYAYLMGWDKIAIYDGGWYEWSMDVGNPVESGIPEEYAGSDRPKFQPSQASSRR